MHSHTKNLQCRRFPCAFILKQILRVLEITTGCCTRGKQITELEIQDMLCQSLLCPLMCSLNLECKHENTERDSFSYNSTISASTIPLSLETNTIVYINLPTIQHHLKMLFSNFGRMTTTESRERKHYQMETIYLYFTKYFNNCMSLMLLNCSS